MPMEEKKKYMQQRGGIEGYGQIFVKSEEQKLDWSDMFYVDTLPRLARNPRIFNQLPVPFREAIEEYADEIRKLTLTMLECMAKALKIDADELKFLYAEGIQGMRMNYYPPCPQPDLAIGLSPHSDSQGLTFLIQLNEVEGLQIKKDGRWIPVKPLPHAFTVNIGDALEQGYIKKVLHQFRMLHSKPVPTPILVGTKVSMAGDGVSVDSTVYRSMVGSLRYVTCTRPDILFAVGIACRYMEAPTREHLNICKRILRYLKGTLTYGLWFSSGSVSSNFILSGYSDSDWGNDIDGRRSTTGFIFCLGLTPFTWVSKLQPIVTLSSSEAEYVALASAVSHGLWLRQLLAEVYLEQGQATEMFVDNQSAIAIAKNPVYHDRSKHIDVRFHFLRESVANGVVKLGYVKTQEQLADILTKPLPTHSFTRLRSLLGVVDSSLRGAHVGIQA